MGTSKPQVRVLHVITSFGTGGTEQGMINLINRMQGEGIKHELCLFGTQGLEESLARVQDPDLRHRCLHKRFGNDPRVALRLRRVLRSGDFDVVHSRNWPSYLETGLALSMTRSIPAVHSEHGTSFLDARRRTMAYNLFAGRWRRFLFVSERLRREFESKTKIDAAKMRVISNGVDFDRFREVAVDDELRRAFPADWFHVGTAGRFHEVKNHRLLLELARRAKAENRKWRVHFAGDGELRGEYEAFVRAHGLEEHVHFHGLLRRVEQFYPCLDLFVLSSWSEGHPNALLEALASGVSSVSTPVGDVPEFIRDGENGLLVDQRDAEGLFTRIDALERDRDELARLARTGHEDARARYDLSTMVRNYLAMYRELAGVTVPPPEQPELTAKPR
ncbi:MAG: glycosyltransferase [Planctomycetota bacterium]